MSRVILFVSVVALAVYCASAIPAGESERCTTPNKIWDDCPFLCDTKCFEAITNISDCLNRFCQAGCVCKSGYLESKDGSCIASNMCETFNSVAAENNKEEQYIFQW